MSESTLSTVHTFGSHTIDIAALPPASQIAMAKRGLQHYLGNEMSSKVSTAKARRAAEIAAWTEASGTAKPVEHTPEEISALLAEHVKAGLEALAQGTVGQGRGPAAPKADPVEAVMRRIAVSELQTILKAQTPALALPTGEKVVTFANGKSFTREQLVSLRMASPKEGPRIRDAALREIKARDKAAKAAASAAEGQDLGELLGL